MRRVEFPSLDGLKKVTGRVINRVNHFGLNCLFVVLDDVDAYYGKANVLRNRFVNVVEGNCRDVQDVHR